MANLLFLTSYEAPVAWVDLTTKGELAGADQGFNFANWGTFFQYMGGVIGVDADSILTTERAHSGSRSLMQAAALGKRNTFYMTMNDSFASKLYLKEWVYIPSGAVFVPNSSAGLAGFGEQIPATGQEFGVTLGIHCGWDGVIRLYAQAILVPPWTMIWEQFISDSLPRDTWFKLEIFIDRSTTPGAFQCKVDGVLLFDMVGQTKVSNPVWLLRPSSASNAGVAFALFTDELELWDDYAGAPPAEYNLTISARVGGTTNPAPGTYAITQNTSRVVYAISDVGYNFNRWLLDGIASTLNPITVAMNADHLLEALFAPTVLEKKKVIGMIGAQCLIQVWNRGATLASEPALRKLTHANYAAISVTNQTDPTLWAADWNFVTSVVQACHSNGVKAQATLSGWGVEHSRGLDTIMTDPALRSTLITNLLNIMTQYNLDGLDIDWESYNVDHAARLDTFLIELRARMPSGKLLTIDGCFGDTNYGLDISVDVAINTLDWINVMAYDIWAGDEEHSRMDLVVGVMNRWLAAGFPANKLVMGIPFYGKDPFPTHTAFNYRDIVDALSPPPSQNGATGIATMRDTGGVVVSVTEETIWWNGQDLCKQKAQYVVDNGFAGVFYCDFGRDKLNTPYSLAVVIEDTLAGIPIPSHILAVTTVPILGVPIVLNGQNYITPTPPLTLPEGSHSVSCPSNVIVGSDTYNFSQWEDGSANPQRIFTLTANATITAIYMLVQPPPAKGRLEVHAFLDSTEIVADGLIVETGQTFQTPAAFDMDPGTYAVRVAVSGKTSEQWATIAEDQTVRLDFQFTTPPPTSPISPGLILGGLIIGGVILSSTSK